MVMIKESLDAHDESSCYYQIYNETVGPEFVHEWPAPTVEGFFQGETKAIDLYLILFLAAFSTIMFAFAGASTFPTIQADMKDRRQFPLAAISATLSSFSVSNCSNMLSIFSSPIYLLFNGSCGLLSAW